MFEFQHLQHERSNYKMKFNDPAEYEADIVIIGFGSAGGCAAIEARQPRALTW